MRHKKRLTGLIVILGSLIILSAFVQPAFAAERIIRFDNPGCA